VNSVEEVLLSYYTYIIIRHEDQEDLRRSCRGCNATKYLQSSAGSLEITSYLDARFSTLTL